MLFKSYLYKVITFQLSDANKKKEIQKSGSFLEQATKLRLNVTSYEHIFYLKITLHLESLIPDKVETQSL